MIMIKTLKSIFARYAILYDMQSPSHRDTYGIIHRRGKIIYSKAVCTTCPQQPPNHCQWRRRHRTISSPYLHSSTSPTQLTECRLLGPPESLSSSAVLQRSGTSRRYLIRHALPLTILRLDGVWSLVPL